MVNVLAVVPVIGATKSRVCAESAIKYFVMQALGSSLFLLGVIRRPVIYRLRGVMLVGLLFKLGAAPFHFWLPRVISGSQWPIFFLLSSIQKLAPIGLISSISFGKGLYLAVVSGALVGGVCGYNITDLRRMLAYSSIVHMSWMFLASSVRIALVFFY